MPTQTRNDAILRRLLRKEAGSAVKKVLAKSRPADIAAAMEHLTIEEQRRLYRLVDNRDSAAEVLAHLPEDSVREITRQMSTDEVVDLLERMEPDDATDVVDYLHDELREDVVSELNNEDDDVADLLEWPSDSAGGIMSPVVFKAKETETCGEAIAELQENSDILESVFYLYVVDPRDRLTGVISLRTLLVHPPSTPLISIMTRDVITVHADQDQEEVARVVERYDLLGVPVVDRDSRLLGIVTVDDVVDVIREEAAEDMMLMAGVHEPDTQRERSVFVLARYRAGWLLATVVGGIVASELIGLSQDTLHKVALLAGFMPVVMGMGGNVGVQSATLTVRGLATGLIDEGSSVRFLLREVRVGLLLGLFFAMVLGGYAFTRHLDQPIIGLTVATSVTLAVTCASLLGGGVPLALNRAGVDPAVATGPFVTSAVDILGVVIYFTVARFLLGIL